MVTPVNPQRGSHRASVLIMALLWTLLLLALAPVAWGDSSGKSAAQLSVDQDPTGAPYVAGELLVAYEPETSEETEVSIVRESGARTLENLPGEVRLVSFPAVEDESSEEARERMLEQELQNLEEEPQVEAVDYNYLREATFTPDDPRFSDQWGLMKAEFSGAWDDARGKGARIAVVDSGIYSNHPDIGKVVAQNDFVEGDAVADDNFGHGTHVASIAGALTSNDRGVAGGCPKCRLLIAKVIGPTGETTDSKIVEGIGWSVNHGADVVNLSLSGPAGSTVLKATVNDASARGAVVVAAAGNERTAKRQYPAAYRAAIAVSATNRRDKLARFSSRGDWVDLAGPGTNILSTRAGGGYGEMSGTSMSAPFVSALAGLLASQGMHANQIRRRMEATAADLGPKGADPYYGHGRIDANRAVR
ncbi:S8 family peptidase [soil metagenome]